MKSLRQQEAGKTFNAGCNCAQSVLTTFSDILETDKKQLLAVSAGFGGGMGRLQQTCGAATGAYMLFSMYTSKKSSDNDEAREKSALMIRAFTKQFIDKMGATNCKTLIGADLATAEGRKEASEKGLFDTVCASCVSAAVEIVEEMLAADANAKTPGFRGNTNL